MKIFKALSGLYESGFHFTLIWDNFCKSMYLSDVVAIAVSLRFCSRDSLSGGRSALSTEEAVF